LRFPPGFLEALRRYYEFITEYDSRSLAVKPTVLFGTVPG